MSPLVARISFPYIEYFSPLKSVTVPPASRRIKYPAATSHALRLYSQKPSNLPHAVQQRSSAADPRRLIGTFFDFAVSVQTIHLEVVDLVERGKNWKLIFKILIGAGFFLNFLFNHPNLLLNGLSCGLACD